MVAPLDVGNLVRETSVTTGTGAQTLVTIDGKRTFNTEFGTGGTDLFDYFISNPDAAEWERGTGHLSSSTVLVRDTVIESSNLDAAVSFTAGEKIVSNDLPASFHGGQWNLLETVVTSADATVDIINLSSTYFAYKFVWNALTAATDFDDFLIRTSTDNGSTWDAGTSDYAWVIHIVTMHTAPGHFVAGDNADGSVRVIDGLGNAANEKVDCEVTCFNPSSTGFTKFVSTAVTWNAGVSRYDNTICGGTRLSAANVGGVRFLMSTGNITSGTLKVYGIRA